MSDPSPTRVATRHLVGFNKYNPTELLSQLVGVLEKEGLDDVSKEVKTLAPKIDRAWKERGK